MYSDYEKVVATLVEEAEYAKSLICEMENSDGEMGKYMIRDISFHILRKNVIEYEFLNSYLEDVDVVCETSMLINIWIGNDKKVAQTRLAYNEVPLHPEGLKIFLRRVIHSMINVSVKNFFTLESKKTKYSLKSNDPSEIYLEKLMPFSDYPVDPAVLQKISLLSRDMYAIDKVFYSKMMLGRTQTINIVVDSEGRRILESKDSKVLSADHGYLNSQNFILPMFDSLYFNSYDELQKKLSGFKRRLMEHINSHDKIGFIRSGFCPILFDHSSTHTLFHEALVGHLFSGDYIVNGHSTIFKDHLNNNLAEINEDYEPLNDLTLYVDPTKDSAYGAYQFDNEGIRSKKTVLCERGVIKNFLLTRNSAARLQTLSNGHARAEFYLSPDLIGQVSIVSPEARISHLVIDSHNGLSNKDLIAKLREVNAKSKHPLDYFLKVSCQNGFVDPETGSFTMQFESCKKVYYDGRVEIIRGGTISGTPPDLLASIKAVGKQKTYEAGFCGSDSGWVPVSSETPMLILTANFVPHAMPEKQTHIDLKRDKYVPQEFLTPTK